MESTESCGWAQGKHYIDTVSSSLPTCSCTTECFSITHTTPVLTPGLTPLRPALPAATPNPALRLLRSQPQPCMEAVPSASPCPHPAPSQQGTSSSYKEPALEEREEPSPAAPVGTPAAALPPARGNGRAARPGRLLVSNPLITTLCYPGDD